MFTSIYIFAVIVSFLWTVAKVKTNLNLPVAFKEAAKVLAVRGQNDVT